MRATGYAYQAAQSPILPHRRCGLLSCLSVGLVSRNLKRVPRRGQTLGAACLALGLVMAGVPGSRAGDFPLQVAQAAAPQAPQPADPAAPIVLGDYWALVIGINEYPNLPPQNQLQAARPGAEAVARILRQYGVERERISALYDRSATRGNILAVLQGTLRRDVSPGDSLFVYFAGHCQVDPATKDVWWLPSDGAENNLNSSLSLIELQMQISRMSAQHILLVADACVEDEMVGTSKISGDPTVREIYQKKSRWVLASGVPAPRPEGEGGQVAPSAFTRALVDFLRDQQLPYLTPLHLAQEMAERLPPTASQTLRSGPMTGLGDDDGQFVFRLEGANPPTAEIRVPAKEDPRIAMLRQYIETGRSISLPPDLKNQVLGDLQGQVDTLQKEIQGKRRQQEDVRLKKIEEWSRRPAR